MPFRIMLVLVSIALLVVNCKSNKSVSLSNTNMQFEFENTDTSSVSKDSLIAQLPFMDARSLDGKADVYWKIIKRGEVAIPLLIAALTDTTLTNVYNKCKQGRLTVGEVCYFALEEIAEFPAFVVTHIQFDYYTNDCWSFYDYLFDNRYKKEYQKSVRGFYSVNKYVYVKFDKDELTDCRKQYRIQGKLKWDAKASGYQ